MYTPSGIRALPLAPIDLVPIELIDGLYLLSLCQNAFKDMHVSPAPVSNNRFCSMPLTDLI
jgi:hypothetical protein